MPARSASCRARSWVISTTTSKNHEEVETGGATTTKPADLKFANRQLITSGFVPEGTALPKPPGSTILALQQVLAGGQAPVTTTTTAATATTTTAAGDDDHERPGHDDHERPGHDDHEAGGHDHDETFVHDNDQVMKAVVLVGGEGTRLRPLTLSAPKQMLPIVGVPMIERVLGHLASHDIDDGGPFARLPARRLHGGLPGRQGGRPGCDLRRRARTARHGRRRPLRRRVRRHRRDLRGGQRGCAHGSRSDGAGGISSRARRRGHHRPPPGGRSFRLRCGPYRPRGSGAGLRREAATGRGADQRDQCRHLRARALRTRSHPRGGSGLH